MGRAELMIVMFAIAIFGRFSLTVNNVLLESSTTVLQSEFQMNAISAADRLLSEARTLAFDEVMTVTPLPINYPDDFTDEDSLDTETGESYPNFDDVDDFNGYTFIDTMFNGFAYSLAVTVGYVDSSDTENYTSSLTMMKRMDITVTSDYLARPVTLSHIFSFVR